MQRISVIIPAYNAEATLATTLESVLSQTYQHFEVLVIDDGSTDRTAEIAASFSDPRLALHRFPNQGAPTSRNRGIQIAQESYISFIDADDVWSPDKLEKQRAALEEDPQAGVAYSFTTYIDEAGKTLHHGFHEPISGDVLKSLCVRFFLQNGSNALIRREVFERVGLFDTSFDVCDDYDFYLRAAQFFPFALVPEFHIFYRLSSGSLSTQPTKMRRASHRAIDGAIERSPELKPLRREAIAVTDGYIVGKALQNPREWRNVVLCGRCLFSHLLAGRAGLRLLLARRHRAGYWFKRIVSWLLAPSQRRQASSRVDG